MIIAGKSGTTPLILLLLYRPMKNWRWNATRPVPVFFHWSTRLSLPDWRCCRSITWYTAMNG